MVTAFLNFARPQPLDLSEVDAGALLEDCARELAGLFAELRVEIKIAGEFAPLRADERMLRQTFLNLLRNAAEATGDGRDERRVTATGATESGESGGDWFVLRVEDTGPGVAPEDLPRIFIPFFTTKAGGHGVGLALAHRVATQHGGTLAASNAERGGAVFTLRLPLHQRAGADVIGMEAEGVGTRGRVA
jgi:signal transduction histidine kinase